METILTLKCYNIILIIYHIKSYGHRLAYIDNKNTNKNVQKWMS